jgi:predicted phosphoribosyltransferase
LFKDRQEAGRLLAEALSFLDNKRGRLLVLAIPRGGVVVAKGVAAWLGAPLDLIVTRKIGGPGNPELAVGAVTQDGKSLTDPETVDRLGVSEGYLKEEAARQLAEIRRRMEYYRGHRPFPDLSGKTVVLVDDGLATGSTMKAAIQTVKNLKAQSVIVAVPVGPRETVEALSKYADRVVCLQTPPFFNAVGQFYSEFGQVDDQTVKEILEDCDSKSR